METVCGGASVQNRRNPGTWVQDSQIKIWIWIFSPWSELATADDKRAQGHAGAQVAWVRNEWASSATDGRGPLACVEKRAKGGFIPPAGIELPSPEWKTEGLATGPVRRMWLDLDLAQHEVTLGC